MKIEKILSIVTLISFVIGSVYLLEDRYIIRKEYDKDIEGIKYNVGEQINKVESEGLNRINHVTEIQNFRLIDMEIGLLNLSMASMLKIPDEKRSDTFDYDLRELELKREFLIKHKTEWSKKNE
jgi:hypothetical protein